MARLFFIIISLIMFVSPAFSADSTYYIDYVGGADTNTGADPDTSATGAFKHCPGDPNATDNADITLAIGDTIVFKGGVTYEFPVGGSDDYIEANASGSAGHIITYRSGHLHTPTYGTGRAVIDGTNSDAEGDTAHPAVFFLKDYVYITVEGLEIKNLLTKSSYGGLIEWSGVELIDANIIINDNLLYNSYSWGIVIQGGSNGTEGWPENFTITNNTVHDTWEHCVVVRSATSDVLIEGNDISECGTFDPDVEGSSVGNCIGLLLNSSNPLKPITDVIIRGNDLGGQVGVPDKGHILAQSHTTGTVIEDNYFYGKVGYGSIGIAGTLDNSIIRNNVWNIEVVNNEGFLRFYTDRLSGFGSDNIQIVNNTFIGDHTNRTEAIIYFHAGNNPDNAPLFTNVDIRNNILDSQEDTNDTLVYIGQSADTAPVVGLSTLTIDNNAYQSLKSGGAIFYAQNILKNFTDWKSWLVAGSATGADANSNFGQVAFANESGDDFTLLASDTVALDEGVDLSGEGYTDDKDGVTRPQLSAWDIGAYEYDGVPSGSSSANQSGTTGAGQSGTVTTH